MKMTKNELDRLIGRNGRSPTQKDKWIAFWRLWRICKRTGLSNSPFILPAAEMSFHWLLEDNWNWVQLASSPGDRLEIPLTKVPVIIRKMWITTERRRRKFNAEVQLARTQGIICNWERAKLVAAKVRQNGVEIMPEEVDKIRGEICNKIRGSLTKLGWEEKDIPVSDEGILLLLHNNKKVC